MDHKGRLRRLQQELSQHRLDSFLVTHAPNIRYLCGFTGSAGVLLVNERGSVLFTDGRYISQAREEVDGRKVAIGRKAPLLAAASWLVTRRKKLARAAGVAGFAADERTAVDATRSADVVTTVFPPGSGPPPAEALRWLP